MWQGSGVLTRANFADLYSEYKENGKLVARADIATFTTRDEVGNMISGAKINADQVLINANHTLAITGNYMTVDTTNFKLTKDGTVTCREGSFVNVMMSGFSYRSKVTVNDDNYSEFFETKFELEGFKIDGFNIAKAGSWVEFDINAHPTSGFPSVDLPAIRPSGSYSQDKIDSARALVGSKVMFYNKGRAYVSFNGYYKAEDDGTGVSFAISQGQFAILECKLGVTSDGKEDIYWLYNRGTAHVTGS